MTADKDSAARHALAGLLIGTALADSPIEMRDVVTVTGLPAREVLTAADLHRLTPAVYRRLRDTHCASDEWLGPFAFRRHEQLMRHMRAIEDLKHAGAVLDAAGVPWVTVKGPVLAEQIWPSPDMRQYRDLDLIVDRRRFSKALASLQDAGVQLVDRNWPLLASSMRAEVAMLGRFGTPLDLHWDIAVPHDLRRAFRTDMPGMFARSGRTTIARGVPVWTLDPIDTVLHLVFHAAQAGANLLVWLADIRFATLQVGFDWAEFERRARRARFEVPAAMVIARIQRTLGFPEVPSSAVLSPAAGVWGRLAAQRDDRAPFPGLPGDTHLGGNMYSSARRGLIRTVVTSGRAYLAVRRIEAKLDDIALGEERILHRDVRDDAARESYLDRTENAAHP